MSDKKHTVSLTYTNKPHIEDNQLVKVKDMGNITEISYFVRKSHGGNIVKLNNDYYLDSRSGEIKQFNHSKNRSENIAIVAQTLKKLRDLLNTNIVNTEFCRWITLTYAENMLDTQKLAWDFKHCVVRLRKIFGHFEYIVCAEPQARGAWHLHCVLIFPDVAPFMHNSVVANCWKKGFVKVQKLDNVDNVGAYLTAYLGDMEYDENYHSEISDKQIKSVDLVDEVTGKKVSKKYIKGGRLHMYPAGFNMYRKSKGIKEPIISEMEYERAKQKVSRSKLTFQKSLVLETSNFKNILHYEYYNSIRKDKSQDKE